MGLSRWNPVSEMLSLREAMDRLFEESFVRPWGGSSRMNELMMPIDMYEEDNSLIIKTSIPGVKPEDINIQLQGDLLTITGEIHEEPENGNSGQRQTQRQMQQSQTQQGQMQQESQPRQEGQVEVGQPQAPQGQMRRESQPRQEGAVEVGQPQAPQGQMQQSRGQMQRRGEQRNWHMREHRHARFQRSITLPIPVQADKAEATCDNGVLILRLPEAEQAQARRIEVKTK